MLKLFRATLLCAATAGLMLPPPGLAPLDAASGAAQQQGRAPLCRRPGPLPQLPPEGDHNRAGEQVNDYGYASPVPVTAPPAPPPPPPPAAVAPPPPPPPSSMEPPPIGETAAPPVPIMPPPAPEPTATGSESDDSSIVLTGTRRTGRSARRPASEGRRRGGVDEPQSGQLTAGEHDDLLNPELYARYVARSGGSLVGKGVPVLDTRRVFTVAVQDEAGRPVPFAAVTLTCADGNTLTLETVADGTAIFFPAVDRLGDRVRVSVAAAGSRAGEGRPVRVFGRSEAQRHRVTMAGAGRAVTRFDLFLAVDTTGSMDDELDYLKSELRAIVGALRERHRDLDIRVGLVVYRDQGDEYVTRTFPFTGDTEQMREHLAAQSSAGGGDLPEAMDEALARAVAQEWRPDAVRAILLVAERAAARRECAAGLGGCGSGARAPHPHRAGRRFGRRRSRRVRHARHGGPHPVALPVPHRRQRHRQPPCRACRRLLPRHPPRQPRPPGPRQPDLGPPHRTRRRRGDPLGRRLPERPLRPSERFSGEGLGGVGPRRERPG
ncbi:MAG TPA: vWA domain-containing protein [Allosphingosinicella sp.]|nr:vWA domain-containing protein [Allosphingosinicella sp.]